MAYRYTAYDWQGRKVSGFLDSDSEEDAYERLRRDDLIPYRIKEVRPRRSLVRIAPSLFKPKAKALVDFSRQLSSLLDAGIPLRRSLMVLRDETGGKGLKDALTQVVEDIESGQRFSEACARQPTVFPPFYVRLLRVSEAAGGINFALQRLADNLEKRSEVMGKVRKAITYPAISLVVAFIAGIILITYALPSLISLLDEFGGQMPLMTRMLIFLAEIAQTYALMLLALVAGIAVCIFLYTRTKRGLMVRDRLLLRLPVVGKVLINSSMFSLTSTFAALIDSGVPPVEALRLSGQGLGNAVLRDASDQITKQTSEGVALGRAFRHQPLFPQLIAQGITTGETTGNLPSILTGLANYYEAETERLVSAATDMIQPAVILMVAGAVGFVAIAVISGIYSTIGAIQ